VAEQMLDGDPSSATDVRQPLTQLVFEREFAALREPEDRGRREHLRDARDGEPGLSRDLLTRSELHFAVGAGPQAPVREHHRRLRPREVPLLAFRFKLALELPAKSLVDATPDDGPVGRLLWRGSPRTGRRQNHDDDDACPLHQLTPPCSMPASLTCWNLATRIDSP
jgi:hypothetical protein